MLFLQAVVLCESHLFQQDLICVAGEVWSHACVCLLALAKVAGAALVIDDLTPLLVVRLLQSYRQVTSIFVALAAAAKNPVLEAPRKLAFRHAQLHLVA